MYLRVKFGDNDFGLPVELALKRIWQDVRKNNWMLVDFRKRKILDSSVSDKTLSQVFVALHEAGILQLMLELAVDCENNYSRVEHATRGLYWKEVDWERHKKEMIEAVETLESITEKYLSLTLSIHPNKNFAKKWANGEEVYLNLETGTVKSY